MNCKLIRIVTGEEIIAEVLEETASYIKIQNALVVIPSAQNVGFAPWATVISKEDPEIEIQKNHIVYVVEIQEDVANKYNEMFGSKLQLPTSKKLIM
jgi:membrane-anchored protein YejM (alkaline phosphatase superfamily)|tara:strand:+ start:77 stop:367 length:291 start_codon:yes stop_codon:yes gene_type:complete